MLKGCLLIVDYNRNVLRLISFVVPDSFMCDDDNKNIIKDDKIKVVCVCYLI